MGLIPFITPAQGAYKLVVPPTPSISANNSFFTKVSPTALAGEIKVTLFPMAATIEYEIPTWI